MKAKKMVCFIVLCSLLCTTFTGCSSVVDTKKKDGRLKVVATVFAEYDFLRHIAGDKINLSMLMLPGADLHAFDPTPKDVASVQSADLFVTIGGESDAWSEKIMESVDNKNLQTIKLMDCVSNVVEEEVVEGMQTEEEGQEDKEKEFDEHVWTSPKNAIQIVEHLRDKLCKMDAKNAKTYQKNAASYIEKLHGWYCELFEPLQLVELIEEKLSDENCTDKERKALEELRSSFDEEGNNILFFGRIQ